jgi:hypothetical protein
MSSDTACDLVIVASVRTDAVSYPADSTQAEDLAQRLFDTAEVEAALLSIESEEATDLEEFLATLGI